MRLIFFHFSPFNFELEPRCILNSNLLGEMNRNIFMRFTFLLFHLLAGMQCLEIIENKKKKLGSFLGLFSHCLQLFFLLQVLENYSKFFPTFQKLFFLYKFSFFTCLMRFRYEHKWGLKEIPVKRCARSNFKEKCHVPTKFFLIMISVCVVSILK